MYDFSFDEEGISIDVNHTFTVIMSFRLPDGMSQKEFENTFEIRYFDAGDQEWKTDGISNIYINWANSTIMFEISHLTKFAAFVPSKTPYEEPVAAIVRIKPESLNLNSKGFFTAFITLPEGYDGGDIDVSTVKCEGASAIKGKVSRKEGNTFMAVFNRQDLVNITVGDAVSLKINGKISNNGNLFDFEGCDTIRIINKREKRNDQNECILFLL